MFFLNVNVSETFKGINTNNISLMLAFLIISGSIYSTYLDIAQVSYSATTISFTYFHAPLPVVPFTRIFSRKNEDKKSANITLTSIRCSKLGL